MFDVTTPNDLFFHACRTMEHFENRRTKKISDLFFLIMALNHLREWIAPGYKKDENGMWPLPLNPQQKFFLSIWDLPEFRTINGICNGTKHFISKHKATSAEYGLNFDDWDNIDDIQNFDNGPPKAFKVDDIDIEPVLRKIIEFYSTNWFEKSQTT